MFILNHVSPETAQGDVKQIYDMFPDTIPVPMPVQLYSASPRYLVKQMAVGGDLKADDAFEPGLLAALRYIGATATCYEFCTSLNKALLSSMGLSDEEIGALNSDPKVAFDTKEAVLLTLALKALKTPEQVDVKDVDAARSEGWTDSQIFEAVAYAAQMTVVGTLAKTFMAK